MRLSRWFAVACLLLAAPVSAQPIHGHPEKLAYASSAEYPRDSAQCHWTSPTLNNGMPGHTHIDLWFPRDAELSGPVSVRFTIGLFMTDAHVSAWFQTWNGTTITLTSGSIACK